MCNFPSLAANGVSSSYTPDVVETEASDNKDAPLTLAARRPAPLVGAIPVLVPSRRNLPTQLARYHRQMLSPTSPNKLIIASSANVRRGSS